MTIGKIDPVVGQQLADFMKAKIENKVELRPLATRVEHAALDVARYRSHVQTVTDIDRAVQDVMRKIQELDQQRAQLLEQAHHLRDGVCLFTAEAREQAGMLINKHGFTQDEVNALARVPEGIAAVRLDSLVPERIRDRAAAEAATQEPESTQAKA